MTTFAIDNTPVSVTLGDNETYSPASGSVQKLKIATEVFEGLSINGQFVVGAATSADLNGELTVIATDTDVFAEAGRAGTSGVHISGFVIN